MQRIIRKLDELSMDDLKHEHVRAATMIRLPFHLSTGSIFEIVDPDDAYLQLWLRNKVSIPFNSDTPDPQAYFEISQIARFSPDTILTDALIVRRQPELRTAEFEAIKTGDPGRIGSASLRNPGFRLLNEALGAHQMVRLGPYISGMGAMWPRMLTEREIVARILVEVILLAEADRKIDEATALRIFESVDMLPMSLTSGAVGDLRDYSIEQLSVLTRSVRRIRTHAFYELRTGAIAAMLGGDSVVAIVLGCAALEGAHGAFMRLALRNKIPKGSSEFNNFMSSLLREHGFYTLVQLSVRVLMDNDERPTEDELEKCLKGVTIRNAIMHAGIKGTGKYKLREYTTSQINEGYSGIMAVYRAFEAAVEAREESESAS